MEPKAAFYNENCEFQKQNVEQILKKHLKLMNFQKSDAILDVGCGEGSVTFETLLPKIENFEKFMLLDISQEMLNFAQNRCNDDRCEFLQMDITKRDLPEDLAAKFNHIFSFYCLQWVTEEKQQDAMNNLYKMLKPDGDILLILVASSPLYNIWQDMAEDEKWNKFRYVSNLISPYYYSKNPVEKMKGYLNEAGFKIKLVELEKTCYSYFSYSSFLKFSLSVHPYIRYINENETKEFLTRYDEEVKSQTFIKITENQSGSQKNFTKEDAFFCTNIYLSDIGFASSLTGIKFMQN